ncbi:MAG: hypothetical protein LBF60_05170 [Treponema sp.]|jgi:hypothetical protein|nr:hypothetical protein [Treponema sp.]
MYKNSLRMIGVLLVIALSLASCDQDVKEPQDETGGAAAATITFKNDTQFYVQVHQVSFSGPVAAELAPGETVLIEVQPSANHGVGSTYCVTYQYNVADEADDYSGKVFAEGLDPNAQLTFDIQAGAAYAKQIPVPDGIEFSKAFVRIRNASTSVSASAAPQFELAYYGTSYKQAGNQEVSVPMGKTGVYEFAPGDLSNYRLQSVFNEIAMPSTQLQKGFIYDFIFTNEGNAASVIPDVKRQIKPRPVSKWKKDISSYRRTTMQDRNLEPYLKSIARYALSDWRSNYPLNKIIANGGALIAGWWDFGVIDTVAQATGVSEPYEVAAITARDAEWENTVFPATSLYTGTESVAYHTTFNDVVQLSNGGYAVLATYAKGMRCGLWLFFLNANGQLVSEVDIPPAEDNLQSLLGIKLASVNGGFLVLGNEKVYAEADDEWFDASSQFIRTYTENGTLLWEQKYVEPECDRNFAVCGLETAGGYIVCGYAGDGYSIKTVVLTINKTDGSVAAASSFGAASDSMLPYSIAADAKGDIFITGLSTEDGGDSAKAYILKLDSGGAEIWLKRYGNWRNNLLFDLTIFDNLLVASGSVNDSSGDADDYYSWQYGKGWAIKIDTETGIVLKDVSREDVSAFNSIVKLADGGYALAALKSVNNAEAYWFNTFAVKADEYVEF